jgi:acyl carrier protein
MTRGEILNWLASIFDEKPGSLTEATLREQIAGWDSLGTLTLMAEMDEKFDIQLSETDVKGLICVGDLVNFLDQRGKVA